jgi:broad specificity phosphatase PhoE
MGLNDNQSRVYEAYDKIRVAVHQETVQKLANLLGMPVVMKYRSVVQDSRIHEFTFTPR